jgi:dienelactone hydrolase
MVFLYRWVSAVVVLFCLWSGHRLAAQPLLPANPGAFNVSNRTFTLTDNSFPAGNLSFSGLVYYPTSGSGTAANQPVANGQFPVVAFGHGFNIAYDEYTSTVRHIASWGYIVMVPDVQNGFNVNHGTYAQQLGACCKYIVAQGNVSSSPFFGKVVDKTASIGHSMGGGATFLVPTYYPDVDVVIGLAAAETNPSAIAALQTTTTPMQVISGSADNTANEANNQQPMYNAAQGLKQWVSLTGGAHCKFTDANTVCDLVSAGGSLTRAVQLQRTRKYLTAFLEYHIRNNYPMRTFICGDSVQADVAANRVKNQTNIVCPNCTGQTATITPSGSTNLCPGQTVTLDAGAGNLGYTWSNGSTNQTITVDHAQAGTYSVTVVDPQTCIVTASVSVTALPAVTPFTISASNTAICPGQTVTLDAPAGFSQYAWSTGETTPSITVSSAGSYGVTVTNAAGCTGAAPALTITASSAPVPTISGSSIICPGSATTLTAQTTGTPIGYAWSTGETTPSISVNQSGNYSVTVTYAGNCTASSAPFTVTSSSVPALAISAIGGSTQVCAPATVTLTASGGFATYQWSDGQSGPSITVSQSGSYSVEGTTSDGCVATAAPVQVTITPVPQPVITPNGSTQLCAGQSVTLNAPAGFSTYQWSDGQTTPSITVSQAGSYSVTVGQNGCTGTSPAVAVTVSTTLQPGITASGSALCSGGTLTLTADPGFASYQWSDGQTGPSITVSQAGTYSVTVTNAGGCTGQSQPLTVSADTPPAGNSIQTSGSTSFCTGGSVTLTAPAGYASYAWSTGETTSSIVVNQAGTYSVLGTSAAGCTYTVGQPVTVTVQQATTPTITASGPTSFCTGQNVTLSTAPVANATYLWSTGATTSSITVSQSGNYTVTVSEANGCTATSQPVAVTVSGPIAVQISASSTTLCAGASVSLSGSAGFASYQWSTGQTGASISVSQAGSYSLTVTDANGCTGSATVVVSADTPPSNAGITANGSTSFCVGGSVTLTAPAGYVGYLWSTGQGTPSITVSQAGTYSLIGTTAAGCTYSIGQPVVVSVTQTTIPVISASGPVDLCTGQSVTLSIQPQPNTQYQWSNGATGTSITVNQAGTYTVVASTANGCVSTAQGVVVTVGTSQTPFVTVSSPFICPGSPVTLSAQFGFGSYTWSNGQTGQTITVNQAGTYTVVVSGGVAGACSSSSDPIVIQDASQLPPPVISSSLSSGSICSGQTVVLTATTGFDTYLWSNGQSGNTATVTTSGSYTVTAIANGCTFVSTPFSVNFSPVPVLGITAGGAAQNCTGQPIQLTASTGFSSYNWNNGTTGPQLTATASGIYTVTATTAAGCTATASFEVSIQSLNPPVIVSSGSTSVCEGQTVILSVPVSYDTYLWSNGDTTSSITVSASGTYSVSVTSGGCAASSTQSITVTVNPVPAKPEIIPIGTKLEASTGFSTYQWYKDPGPQPVPGGTELVFAPTESGTYYVRVTNGQGCSAFSDPYEYTYTSRNQAFTGAFSVYPSPASTSCTVELQGGQAGVYHLAITNLLGQPVFETNWSVREATERKVLPIGQWPSGVYHLVCTHSATGGTETRSLVIQR